MFAHVWLFVVIVQVAVLAVCIVSQAALVSIQCWLRHGVCADRSVQRRLGRSDNPYNKSNARLCGHCRHDGHHSHGNLLPWSSWITHTSTTWLVHGPHDGECWRCLHLAWSYHVAGHACLPACKRSNLPHAHSIREASHSSQLDAGSCPKVLGIMGGAAAARGASNSFFAASVPEGW